MTTPKLTKQQLKVHDYIKRHPGCTTRDITRDTFVQCPSGRITELRQLGVNIVSVGRKKYPGAHAFECYAIKEAASVEAVTSARAETLAINL